jgi:hypothetical protein
MPKRLLIAAGEAADSADALPFGVRELIEAADEVLVVTPALPTRFEWLASATDKAREQADERLREVLTQIEELGTEAAAEVEPMTRWWPSRTRFKTFQRITSSWAFALRIVPAGRSAVCWISYWSASRARSRSSRSGITRSAT